MTRREILSNTGGLILILILGLGGFYRAQHARVPVYVPIPIEKAEGIKLSCMIKRGDLSKLSTQKGKNKWAETQSLLSEWNEEIAIFSASLFGETMGTSFHVTISDSSNALDLSQLIMDIDDALKKVNREMSTWDPESEISKFNHRQSSEPFECSSDFLTVMKRSLQLSASTDGAFDPTLQPLLNLWGFGSDGIERQVPSDQKIASTREMTGWDKISIKNGMLVKKEPVLSLALGAIAKGYGVDVVGRVIKEAGFENWFVEIGGEVVVAGFNPSGLPWTIGIQRPETNPLSQALQGILHITKGAVATSGDYRNYIIEDDQIYSHILDPRSGKAIHSDLASVTVYTDSCMDADGAATALFVMGAEEGMKWVELHPGTEALFLVRTNNNEINDKFSSGFKAATGYKDQL